MEEEGGKTASGVVRDVRGYLISMLYKDLLLLSSLANSTNSSTPKIIPLECTLYKCPSTVTYAKNKKIACTSN